MHLRDNLLIGLLASAAAVPAHAQQPPPVAAGAETEAAEEGEVDIVVTGQRLRGAVDGDIPPEVTLDERDIRALGAGSIAELIQALAPQVASNRGRRGGMPVLLINGRRISGFSEVRDLPPEAIERFEILPEEVALRYGYPADQRVVNIVLRQQFQAVTAEVEQGVAGRGGYRGDLNYLRIAGAGRLSLNAEYRQDDALFESQRDLIQAVPARPFDRLGNVAALGGGEIDPRLSALAGRPVTIAAVPSTAAAAAPGIADFVEGAERPWTGDIADFRTLLPRSDQISLSATYNRQIGTVSGTLHGRFIKSESESQFGLPSAALTLPATNPFSPFERDTVLFRYFDGAGPLRREVEGDTRHLGFALNGDIAPWRWSVTANYDRSESRTLTDTNLDPATLQGRLAAGDPAFNPFAAIPGEALALRPRDQARTVSESANAEAVFNGPLARLPAGPVSTTLRVGGETRGFTGETLRGGIEQERALSRQRANAQISFDLPIASRREDVLSALGNLSANFNAAVEHLSDFGTLRTIGYGLNWTPIPEITLIASATDEDGAPSMQQLGDPLVATPNVRIFDFVRGETVDVLRIDGGNPDLVADNRRVLRLGLNARPLGEPVLSVIANYTRTRTDNPIASFPTATPEIEAAFPERFVRDAAGRLTQTDGRPVNFARAERDEMRWGVNVMLPFGRPQPGAGGGRFGGLMAAAGARPPGAPPAGQRPEGAGPAGQRPEGAGRWQRPPGAPGAAPQEGAAPQQAPPAPEGAAPPPPQRPAGGFGGGMRGGMGRGGGMMGMMGGPPGQGRLQLALYHTWRFQDRILIREGVPELDLLGGSAIGNRGGRPRHELEAQAGLFRNGLGGRITATWQEGTFVRGAPASIGAADSDLFFSDLVSVNLRLFANLGDQRGLVAQHPWLRNTRLSLAVDNLLDTRLRVRDQTGVTPLGFQPAYLDPIGRSVRISLRKQFF